MSAHTPGPWHVDNSSPGGGNVQSKSGPVADTLRFGNTHNEAMADYANARLMAAAPELLEALQYVLSAHGEQLHDAFEAAHAAIAKATIQPLSGGEGE